MGAISMTIFDVIRMVGGLAMFLYGMSIMGTGLEKCAGGKMESILQKITSSTGLAVLLGAVISALIHSSAGTTVIVVGLVNSGIMQLSQAIGVIMGANIGTTVTSQILRLADMEEGGLLTQLLSPTNLAPMLLCVGAVLFVFLKSPRKRDWGQIAIGIGLLFTGMETMMAAVSGLQDSPLFARLFATLQNPILGLLAGALITVAVQSSTASVGILQALSSTGLVTWGSAIPIILGQNIGTTSTSLIASVGTSKAAKRTAMVHVYFNVIGSIVFMGIIYGAKAVIGFPWWGDTIGMGEIANFHTLFNMAATLLFLPFTKLLAKLAEMTFPDKPSDAPALEIPLLDELLLTSPSVAIQQAKGAVETMARDAYANYCEAIPVLYSHDAETLNLIQQREAIVDKLEVTISNYLVKVSDQQLSERESHAVNELLHFVVEYERIGDYAINVVERSGEMFDKEISFSPEARHELSLVDGAIREILEITLSAFLADDLRQAEQVEPLEETIDQMIETLRDRHILRLKDGVCGIENGIIFLEILTNLERISDHCSNIAARIVGEESDDSHFDAHEFRRNMHDGLVPDFNDLLQHYKEKYYAPLLEAADETAP